MKKLVKIIVSILAVGIAFSCANLGSTTILNEINIDEPRQIEGKYSNTPSGNSHLHYHQFLKLIDHTGKIANADSIISIDVSIVNSKELEFLFMDHKGKKYPYLSRYKLENGRLRLKNRNFRLMGIPYLFGGYKLNRTELTLTSNRDLVIKSLQKDEGAILFIFPASLHPSRFINIYPKI